MQRLFNYLKTVDFVWLVTWGLIYAGFVLLDAFFPGFFGITILKMLGIILCVVYAWQKFRKDSLLIIALGFTLLADTILMIDSTSKLGVIVFCLAQFFHSSRLKKLKPMYLTAHLLMVAVGIMIAALLKIDIMYVLAAIYGYFLFSNLSLSFSWMLRKKSVAAICAFFGFLLFVLCDFCVAVSYLSVTAILPLFLQRFADYFAWVFYYPSQVLISNSSKELEKIEAERGSKTAEKAKIKKISAKKQKKVAKRSKSMLK